MRFDKETRSEKACRPPPKKHSIDFFMYWLNQACYIVLLSLPYFLVTLMRQFCGCFMSRAGVARRVGEETPGLKVLHVPINRPHLSTNDSNKIENARPLKCQWKIRKDYVMEENFFLLEIWLIQVCMFCKFKENPRGSHWEIPRPYLFRKDQHFSSGKCAAYLFC